MAEIISGTSGVDIARKIVQSMDRQFTPEQIEEACRRWYDAGDFEPQNKDGEYDPEQGCKNWDEFVGLGKDDILIQEIRRETTAIMTYTRSIVEAERQEEIEMLQTALATERAKVRRLIDKLKKSTREYTGGIIHTLLSFGFLNRECYPNAGYIEYLTPRGRRLLQEAYKASPQYFDEDPRETEKR